MPDPENRSASESAAYLLATASELLERSNSLEQVWGKLLVAGFDPQAILAALDQLGSDPGLSKDAYLSDPALAGQIALFGEISAQEGMVTESDVPLRIGQKLQKALGDSKVVIFGGNSELTAEFHRLFGRVGVSSVQAHCSGGGANGEADEQAVDDAILQLSRAEASLIICATHGSDRKLADIVNRASVAHAVRVIYYHARGLQIQVGPLVIPRQTACYECYKVRRDAAFAPWERRALLAAGAGGQLANTLGADWVAVDAIKLLAGFGEPVSRGRVLFIDYYAGLPEVHTLLRLPRCTVCGHPRRPVVRLWDDAS